MRVIHLARSAGNSDHGRPDFEPGVSQPANAMADGKLLLSYLPPAERAYLYEVDGLRKYTENTIDDPAKLENMRSSASGSAATLWTTTNASSPRAGSPCRSSTSTATPYSRCSASAASTTTRKQDARLARQMQAMAAEMSAHIAVMGDMPKANTEFAKYNLE